MTICITCVKRPGGNTRYKKVNKDWSASLRYIKLLLALFICVRKAIKTRELSMIDKIKWPRTFIVLSSPLSDLMNVMNVKYVLLLFWIFQHSSRRAHFSHIYIHICRVDLKVICSYTETINCRQETMVALSIHRQSMRIGYDLFVILWFQIFALGGSQLYFKN